MEKGKLCDLTELHSFLGSKWAYALLTNIGTRPVSYNELQAISKRTINPTLLSKRLKDMVRFKIISKENTEVKIVYMITSQGMRLKELLHEIKVWAEESDCCIPEKCKGKECVCREGFEV